MFEDLVALHTLDLSDNPGSGGFLPIADAGADQAAEPGPVVTLSATVSALDPRTDYWGDNVAHAWTQNDNGSARVELTGAGTATPTFVMPAGAAELEFELRVTGRGGAQYTAIDTVAVVGVAPTGVAVTSTPLEGGSYLFGEVIELSLTFDRPVAVDTAGGTPSIEIDVGGVQRQALYIRGGGSQQLVFAYAVQSTDSDGDGIRICGADQLTGCTGAISPNGGALTYLSGLGALLRHPSRPDQGGHRVDGSRTGLSGGICGRTKAVRDELVRRLGAASCAEVTVDQLEGLTGTLSLQSGDLRALRPGDFADLIALQELQLQNRGLVALPEGVFSGLVALESLHLDNNELRTLPAGVFNDLRALRTLDLSDNPGSGGFRPIADAGADQAAESGRMVTLRVAVSDADPSTDYWGDNVDYAWTQIDSGVMVGLTGADTATPTFVMPAGVAELEFESRVTGRGGAQYTDTDTIVVFGVATTSVAVTSTPLEGGTYLFGEMIELALTFDRPVLVDTAGGTPSIELDVGGVLRRASYVRGGGTRQLMFAYAVQRDDRDTDGVRICGTGQLAGCTGAISPNGGALKYGSGRGALLGHPSPPVQGGHGADGSRTGLIGGICGRTGAVRDALVRQVGASACSEVTAGQLRGLTGTLSLADRDIGVLKPGDFADLTGLEYLMLSGNRLVAIPEGILSDLASLETLSLHGNSLETIQEGLFSGLQSLRVLWLHSNLLTAVPEGLFAGLTELETLSLHDNSLTAVPEGLFAGLAELETLSLQDNDLMTLPAGVFSDLRSLRTLDLSGNPGSSAFLPIADAGAGQAVEAGQVLILRALASDTDPWGDNVAHSWVQTDNSGVRVELTGVDTATLSFVAPASVVELEFELRVTGRGGRQYMSTDTVVVARVAPTSVAVISNPVIGDIYLLDEVIELALTFDRAVLVDTAGGVPSIDLDIGGVQRRVSYVRGSGSWQLVFAYTVQQGDLDADGIRTCGAGQLRGCTGAISPNGGALKYGSGLGALLGHPSQPAQGGHQVDGSHRGLSGGICGRTRAVRDALLAQTPTDRCFLVTAEQLRSLTASLDLSNSGIETLKPDDFAGLTELRNLQLPGNELLALPADVFSDLASLTALDLGSNRLTTLPAGVFSGLASLTTLDLGGNRLTTLPAGVFSGLASLTTLDLGGNRLTTLPADVFLRPRLADDAGSGQQPPDDTAGGRLLRPRLADDAGSGRQQRPDACRRTIFPDLTELTNLDLPGNERH